MSHFTVLVIGDHETLLAPFDENIECEPRWESADYVKLDEGETWASKAAAYNDEDELIEGERA